MFRRKPRWAASGLKVDSNLVGIVDFQPVCLLEVPLETDGSVPCRSHFFDSHVLHRPIVDSVNPPSPCCIGVEVLLAPLVGDVNLQTQ